MMIILAAAFGCWYATNAGQKWMRKQSSTGFCDAPNIIGGRLAMSVMSSSCGRYALKATSF
jgi:hypothetical protein